jgi:triacylglycerol esterase/lipase EstA (alpha/beta hydrolase family)
MHRLLALAAAALALGPAATTASAADSDFAPPSVAGPALSISQATIESRLNCSPGVAGASRAPVLLVQGTGATAKDNWSWTYQPALDQRAIPWCTIDLPDQATSDVQVNGEFVVGAIRTMHARAGRKISIIGHSQGGMVPRWALAGGPTPARWSTT